MADVIPEFDIENATGGQDTAVAIQDGGGTLKAKVEAKTSGENALHVISEIKAILPTPTVTIIHAIADFDDSGSSRDMTIDGSSTAVEFTAGPAASSGDIWIAKGIAFRFHDNGVSSRDKFGAIMNGLTNGLLLELDKNGTKKTLRNFKNNGELSTAFAQRQFRGVAADFINDTNYFAAFMRFEAEGPGVKLTDVDKFIFTVRDDLTGLIHF